MKTLEDVKKSIKRMKNLMEKNKKLGAMDTEPDTEFQLSIRKFIDTGKMIFPKKWHLFKSEHSPKVETEMDLCLGKVLTDIGGTISNPDEYEKTIQYLNNEVIWRC